MPIPPNISFLYGNQRRLVVPTQLSNGEHNSRKPVLVSSRARKRADTVMEEGSVSINDCNTHFPCSRVQG